MSQVANIKGPLGLRDLDPDPAPARKKIRQRSRKREKYLKSDAGKAALEYMACVAALPCAVCNAPPPSVVHHCIHGRFSSRRASDQDTIPLCYADHDQNSPNGIHKSKTKWAAKHGPDTGYIKRTRKLVQEMMESVDF